VFEGGRKRKEARLLPYVHKEEKRGDVRVLRGEGIVHVQEDDVGGKKGRSQRGGSQLLVQKTGRTLAAVGNATDV